MERKTTIWKPMAYVAVAAMAVISIGAQAATTTGLTPKECRSYPFVKTQHVTHHALMTELSEMEAVGYQPTAEDATYPSKLDIAEHRLQREYQADCRNISN